MKASERDAAIESIIKKTIAKSLDLKLFDIRFDNLAISFDSSLLSMLTIEKGWPVKIVFGRTSLPHLDKEINRVLQYIQKHGLLQTFAVAKWKHVKVAERKWNREFIHSQQQGIFSLIPRNEIKVETHKITIMTHQETGVSINYVGNDVNETKMQIELSKRVADHILEQQKDAKSNINKS